MNRLVALSLLVTLLISVLYLGPTSMQASDSTTYIRANGSVDPETPSIRRNGDLYTFLEDVYSDIIIEKGNIVVDGNDHALQGNSREPPSTGLYWSGVDNVTIKKMTIQGFYFGIHFGTSLSSSILGNRVTNNTESIRFSDSSGTTVSGNAITGNTYCITIKDSYGTTICGNDLSYNGKGTSVLSSTESTITHNNILSNDVYGLNVNNSSESNVSENQIRASNIGVMTYYSSNITFVGNSITNNGLMGFELYSSSDCLLFHNSFVENGHHVMADYSDPGVWDAGYRLGGNYWDSSSQIDVYCGPNQDQVGSDGIVDQPHVCSGGNVDHYPLVFPWNEEPRDKSAIIVDPGYTDTPNNNLLTRISNDLEYAGYTISDVRKGEDVTVAWLRTSLRHGVVFWRGHGLENSGWFTLAEMVTPENQISYKEDHDNLRILISSDNHWIITPKFIQYYYGSSGFQYSLVYAEVCYGLKNEQEMPKAFIDCGAGAFVGYRGKAVTTRFGGWADTDAEQFFGDTCRKGYTVSQAASVNLWFDPLNSRNWQGDGDLKLFAILTDCTGLRAVAHCPVEILFTDPSGRRIGMDPASGQIINEIPDAIYVGGNELNETDARLIWIPESIAGNCSIEILGIGTGLFNLTMALSSTTIESITSFASMATINQIIDCEISVTENAVKIISNSVQTGGGRYPFNV